MSRPPGTKSQYSQDQIFKHVFDETTAAFKIVPHDNMHFQVDLSIADGDCVSTQAIQTTMNVASSPTSCVGMKTVVLYLMSGSNCKIQVSPEDSGSHWFDLVTQAAPGMTSVTSMCARRFQVIDGGGSSVFMVVANG
jgi:hypothetical protein